MKNSVNTTPSFTLFYRTAIRHDRSETRHKTDGLTCSLKNLGYNINSLTIETFLKGKIPVALFGSTREANRDLMNSRQTLYHCAIEAINKTQRFNVSSNEINKRYNIIRKYNYLT